MSAKKNADEKYDKNLIKKKYYVSIPKLLYKFYLISFKRKKKKLYWSYN